VDGHERVLRLYFVDAPESDTRFPQRNAEQAAYFGITSGESVEAGKAAKTYVRTLLAGKKLTVFTRWASALGSSRAGRFYAIVEVDGHNLADLLVENGLARVHGTNVTLPDGTKIPQYLAHLAELEASAREKKLGAWLHSIPAASRPTIVEVKEVAETPRWLERLGFTSLGAALMASLVGLRRWIRRRAV
jgi:endonuclease YncB( thermonuclease family)